MSALLAVALIAITGSGYLISLKVWPDTYCRRCGGNGKNRGSTRKRWGYCPRCGGTGRKRRLGNRVFRRP